MSSIQVFLTFVGLGLLMLGGVFTVSTFETHTLTSLLAGVVFGGAGVVVSLYSMTFVEHEGETQ